MENLKGQLKIYENGATSLYIYDESGYIAEGNDRKKVEELVNRFNSSIQLKNIDLTGISKLDQLKKTKEELKELTDALIEDEFYSDEEGNKEYLKDHIIEEFWDLVQSYLGLLEKHGISAEEVQKGYSKHIEKLNKRGNKPREKKCSKCTCCETIRIGFTSGEERRIICHQLNGYVKEEFAKECKCYKEQEE